MYDIFLLLAGAQRTLLSLQLVLRASRRSQNSTFVGSNRAAQGGSYPEKLGCCGHRRNIELLQPMSRCAARVEKWEFNSCRLCSRIGISNRCRGILATASY